VEALQRGGRQEARTAGLTRRALDLVACCAIPVGLATVTGIVAAIADASVSGGYSAATTVLVASVIAVGGATRRAKLTDRGKAAAEWWRQHGGGFDGAIITDQAPPGALPSPHSPESLTAQGSGPLPDGVVWSSFGGRWRTVKVGPLTAPSWGRPQSGIMLGVFGAVLTLPATVIGQLLVGGGIGNLLSVAPAALFGGLILGVWFPAYRRRAAIPKNGVFDGQVVKRWTRVTRSEDSNRTFYYCCIDDGASSEGWTFEVERSLYDNVRVGDGVSVEFNPRWHRVKRIQLTAPVPGPRV
jgi:hypothetical protein